MKWFSAFWKNLEKKTALMSKFNFQMPSTYQKTIYHKVPNGFNLSKTITIKLLSMITKIPSELSFFIFLKKISPICEKETLPNLLRKKPFK